MKINLPKSAKSQIKAARKKVFDEMNAEFISQTTWDEMNKRYQGYTNMMKPSWTITPDTVIVALTSVFEIFMVLNFEKLDILRSKAIGFVLKGRV